MQKYFSGIPEEIALTLATDDISVTTNIYAERAMQQALYSTIQLSIARHMGEYFGLPYWRILQHDVRVSDAAKASATANFEPNITEHRLRTLAFAAELEIDLMTSDTMTEKDRATLDAYMQEHEISSDPELARHFWTENSVGVAGFRVGFVVDPLKTRGRKKSTWQKIKDGFGEITGSDEDEFHLIMFILAMFMLMATAGTIYGAPFYALGIELAPSYHGRTRVVIYRAWFSKIQNILMLAFPILIMMPIFYDAKEGGYILSSILFGRFDHCIVYRFCRYQGTPTAAARQNEETGILPRLQRNCWYS